MTAEWSAAWTDARARAALLAIFNAGVARAQPAAALAAHLPPPPSGGGRCIVVGAGKASAAMAAALEQAWPDVPMRGLVITRYGHAAPTRHIRIVEASHPVPDAAGLAASAQMLALLQGLGPQDLVIALISGGGSALLVSPAEGVSFDEKQAVNRALLRSGAAISEMNVVRKQLSRVKGGRLALAAAPARVVTLVISDIPGDDPAVIASGPTLPDHSTGAEALRILDHYAIPIRDALRHSLATRAPAPTGFPVDLRMIATPALALEAMADEARRHGLNPMILGDALEGEASALGTMLTGIAHSVARHGQPIATPAVLLSGGEGTVTIGAGPAGKGGRNTEAMLAAALAAGGAPGIWAIAGDSDGIDGSEDAAGALITPDTLARTAALGLDPRGYLARHDSYSLFEALGDLVMTGPTLTNVNDLRAFIVTGAAQTATA